MMAIQTFRLRRCGPAAVPLALLFTAVSSAACGTPIRAASDWERGVDLSPSKTFSVARSPTLPSDLTPEQTRVVALVDDTIKRELEKKGYREAPADSAELVLMSNFAFRDRMRVGSHACADFAPNVSRSSCQQSTISNYDEATLLIDVYDGHSHELVWHGWATGERPKPDEEDTPELAKQATLDILEHFPP